MRVAAYYLLGAGLLLNSTGINAASPSKEQVLNNMSHELVECIAYYGIVIDGAEKEKEYALARKYNQVLDKVMEMAIYAGLAAGLNDEAQVARLDIARKTLSEKIDHNLSNIAILNKEYSVVCKEAVEYPDKRVKYWYSKLDK